MEQQDFVFVFPAFCIVAKRDADMEVVFACEKDSDRKGFAIFTDFDYAERYRDKYAPTSSIGTINDIGALVDLVDALSTFYEDVKYVGVDPSNPIATGDVAVNWVAIEVLRSM